MTEMKPEEIFEGDPTPDISFNRLDGLRTVWIYALGAPLLAFWMLFFTLASRFRKPWEYERWAKACARSFTRLAGIRVSVRGREFLDPKQTCIFAPNHVNLFDMFVLYQSIPVFTRSLELAEHFSWPVFGRLITAAGQIPVDPADIKVTAKGLRKAGQMLKDGHCIMVLPEGMRTRDGRIGKFYPGAFRLAIQAQVPVVPIVMKGARKINHPDDWRIRPGKVEVIFGKPVATHGMKISETEELGLTVRNEMIRLLNPEAFS